MLVMEEDGSEEKLAGSWKLVTSWKLNVPHVRGRLNDGIRPPSTDRITNHVGCYSDDAAESNRQVS